VNLVLLAFVITIACGCTIKPASGPEQAFYEVAAPTSLSDDLRLAGLNEAIEAQQHALQATGSDSMQIGPVSILKRDYGRSLAKLSTILTSDQPLESKLSYIRENFRFFEFAGANQPGRVLLTGYFEPIIAGSLSRTAQLSRPLYRKPSDLLSIPLSLFSERFKDEKALKGRLASARVVPYFSRAEIDGQMVLAGKGLELAWVDPIDAFFLQIQGSGTLRLANGEEVHLVYADKNGQRYEAIGKFLKSALAPNPVTMPRVEKALRAMTPTERDRILFLNPSYVFFERSKKRAITSLGVPATPGRTVAVDPRFAPKGALAYLSFQKPEFSFNQVSGDDPTSFQDASRFVLDQDSGGAITGTGRVDLFWGRGDDAKRHAGVMQHSARILYLVPKEALQNPSLLRKQI
jgi:membrane-bound lytic murein transglycosylase A